MKISLYTLLPGLLGLLLAISCKQTNIIAEPEPAEPVIEETKKEEPSSWQSFKSLKEFDLTMKTLQNLSQAELVKWESNQPGYSSWRAKAELGTDSSVADIPDAGFATVLNKEGRIQIADTIYQFVPGQQQGTAYAIPEIHKPVLLKGAENFLSLKGTKAYNITLTWLPFPRWEDDDRVISPNPGTNICDFPGGFLFPWWGQKGGQIFHADNGVELSKDNGRRVRIDYHRWRVGYLFYSSAGIRVKAWKDTRLGGWMSNINMDQVNMESCIKGKIIIPGLFPANFQESISLSATNTNKLEKTLQWASAPMHVEILPEHFNFKFSATYRGQNMSRFIRE